MSYEDEFLPFGSKFFLVYVLKNEKSRWRHTSMQLTKHKLSGLIYILQASRSPSASPYRAYIELYTYPNHLVWDSMIFSTIDAKSICSYVSSIYLGASQRYIFCLDPVCFLEHSI